MLLALDVGNSAVKGGLFEDTELVRTFSAEQPEAVPTSQMPPYWTDALASPLMDVAVDRVGLASVVPASTDPLRRALRAQTDAPVTILHPGMALPFRLDYETPGTLGTDRLAGAVAGWTCFGQEGPQSVLVVDAGTAVNYEVIHRDGVYQGGAIAAGPVLLRTALRRGTAQLPEVPLTPPETPIGRSTQAALQSGIMGGFLDSVRGMVDRLVRSVPDDPVVVGTGGWSSLLVDALDHMDHHDPHLVLRGIRVLMTMNE